MRMSYLAFVLAFVALIATAAYRDAWVAAAVFAGGGVILLAVEQGWFRSSRR